MKKLLVICPPLVVPYFRSRWLYLANAMGREVEVLALAPKERRWSRFGRRFNAESFTDGRFTLECVNKMFVSNSRYLIRRFSKILRKHSPDLIFCVHHEGVFQLLQTIVFRKLFAGRAKLVYFSMTAFPRIKPLRSWHPKHIVYKLFLHLNWWLIRHGTDGALCHYDRIEAQMRREGYVKPILQQTQYGVDPRIFHPDSIRGAEIRQRLGLEGVVIGFCGGLVDEKGIHEIMQAFDGLSHNCSLILVGDGPLLPEVEAWVVRNNIRERVKLTGFVDPSKVHEYFQAMDIFVLGSKETSRYIDTFPLVVAQAMATGLPVVGSISGAIPYQLGGLGRLFPEGDAEMLREHLQALIDHPEERVTMGERLRKRALENFCIEAMNERFLDFVENEVNKPAY